MLGCITGVGLPHHGVGVNAGFMENGVVHSVSALKTFPRAGYGRPAVWCLLDTFFYTHRGNRTGLQYRTPEIDRCRSSLSLRHNHLDPNRLRMKRLQVISRQLTANTSSQDGESFWAGVPQVWCCLDQPLIECSGSPSGKRAARTCCVMCSQPC
jgi:hypothetical protein